MHPIHDHDPLFLLAVGLAAKRRPAELVEIVAAIDFLQIKAPLEQRFLNGKRHPNEMGHPEVEAYLNHLAVDRRVSASTQTQALNAIVFLYALPINQES